MATTLTNPVNSSNIINRFYEFARATANTSIIWGNPGNLPFPGAPPEWFGGTIAGTTATVASRSGQITASNIYDDLLAATVSYTNIRNLTAVRLTTRSGFSNNADVESFRDTKKTHMAAALYRQAIPASAVPNAGVAANQQISSTNLETLFGNLRTAYETKRDTGIELSVRLCHSSCHQSCHNSRIRR